MATVVRRRGKWVGDFRNPMTGRRHWITRTTRKEAEAALQQALQEINAGSYQGAREQITFAGLCDAYESAHIAVAVRPATAASYRSIIGLHLKPYFGALRVRRLTMAGIERFRAELAAKLRANEIARIKMLRDLGEEERQARLAGAEKFGTRQTNKALTLLVMMLGFAEKHGWVGSNPARHVKKLQSPAREIEPLTPAEVGRLLDHAVDPWRPLIMVAALTGARQGEVLALQWGDIDWQSRRIHVRRNLSGGRLAEPKTASGRRAVDLCDALARELKRWKLRAPISKLDLCFPTEQGKPQSASNLINRGWLPTLRRAGLRRVTFHSLRHGVASALLASGTDLVRVQKQLGHASASITLSTYAHAIPGIGDNVGAKLEMLFVGSKTVATEEIEIDVEPQVLDLNSGSGWIRTNDQGIMSPLL